jgi:cytochrome P450
MLDHVSTPADVESILGDPAWSVRPATEPVPPRLAGTRLADVLARIPRFTDGESHRSNRRVSEDLIRRLESGPVVAHVERALNDMRHTMYAHEWMIAICPLSLAHAFDVWPGIQIDDVASLARGLGPAATDRDLALAVEGCEHLWESMSPKVPADLERAAAIGLLFQGFDSVAALIGNGLVAGARQPGDVRRLLVETPPIRTTRRFDAQGRPVVVDLEAATRATGGMPSYAFGYGLHRCPGQVLAFTIATHALEHAPRLSTVPDPVAFLPYPNANVPDLRGVELDWNAA